MIYLSCQPSISRYTWEVEVYIENFLKIGITPQKIHVVLGLDTDIKEIPSDWIKLREKYQSVYFFFYPDTRENNNYQPSLQAHILEKHWLNNKWLEKEDVFFHDADFIFTKPFDFTPFLGDDIWYFSNTISYIGGEYIRSKGEVVLETMCEIAGLDKEFVLNQEKNSGGAQKLIKSVPTKYWKDTFDLQMRFWNEIPPVSRKIGEEKGESYHPLQHWTMSMWAELWMGWKYGRIIRVPKEFDFMFYTNSIEDWDKMSMFHNAGVVGSGNKMFFKGLYTDKLPYGDIQEGIREDLAGYKYYQWVQEVGKTSCLS